MKLTKTKEIKTEKNKMEDEDIKLNVSYGLSNEKTISAGEFEVEIWTKLEDSLDAILRETVSRFTLKDFTSVSITIKPISAKEK